MQPANGYHPSIRWSSKTIDSFKIGKNVEIRARNQIVGRKCKFEPPLRETGAEVLRNKLELRIDPAITSTVYPKRNEIHLM